MQYRSLFPLIIALCILPTTRLGADVTALRVVYDGKQFSVPAFEHGGVLYASLNEFASALTLPLYVNDEARKVEVRIADFRLKLTENNPFIVVLAHRENIIREVYQLPVDVMRSEVAFYVPMASMLPILSKVWNKSLLLDRGVPQLIVSTSSRPVVQVTGAPAGGATAARSASSTAVISEKETNDPKKEETTSLPATPAPAAASTAYDITHVTVDTRKNGTLIRLHTRREVKDFSAELKDDKLVVTVPDATVDGNELRQTPTDGEGVTAVNAEQLGRNTRITFTLNDAYSSSKVSRDVKTGDVLVSLFKKVEMDKILREEASRQQDGARSKWKLDCIVIDAGHGGKDPGAIGVTGVKEKNITLGIALKLGKLIEHKMPGVKVVYTRKDDTFIPLDKRGQIANAAGGKLFISLHCNSTEKKPSSARGFEVYILRPGRTEEAIRIAEFENSVIKLEKDWENRYAKLDNESFILINMAQSAYVRYSERFAELLHDQVKDSDQIKSKGVKQAGFYVLVGASMPSVLIEGGFISNPLEEKFLASRFGQQHLANLFYTAIENYAREYEKDLKE
ncbi:MAG: N-acetylmuramoyl-L-alanine amidase [Bacteroidetes bacterium]|nr:N-acetylmuramoyl-L-alanine amidase [Bacteroidota bacterium]